MFVQMLYILYPSHIFVQMLYTLYPSLAKILFFLNHNMFAKIQTLKELKNFQLHVPTLACLQCQSVLCCLTLEKPMNHQP